MLQHWGLNGWSLVAKTASVAVQKEQEEEEEETNGNVGLEPTTKIISDKEEEEKLNTQTNTVCGVECGGREKRPLINRVCINHEDG